MRFRTKVLVMVDWYAPGFRAGGPIRSAVNFAAQLEKNLDIFVITRDRDLEGTQPYPDIVPDRWLERGGHHVFYASPRFLSWKKIRGLIIALKPDTIYLNSMFSRYFSVYPLLMKRFGLAKGKVVLAPRGMLKDSALSHKAAKKRAFLRVANNLGLYRHVHFHATDTREQRDIEALIGAEATISMAGNLPGTQHPMENSLSKVPGSIRLLFIGRTHPIKNLPYLLELLGNMEGKIELTIIATQENPEFWKLCLEQISALPANIVVRHFFDVPNEDVGVMIKENHLMVLPTAGENFGHAIFESLSAGRPVLISDQTPWRNLQEKNAGWDLPLAEKKLFMEKINEALTWQHAQWVEHCMGAWLLAKEYLENQHLKDMYIKLMTP